MGKWSVGVFAICVTVTKEADRRYWASVSASNARKVARSVRQAAKA
jgi:hypothetical protein